jgi:hypothetical protein
VVQGRCMSRTTLSLGYGEVIRLGFEVTVVKDETDCEVCWITMAGLGGYKFRTRRTPKRRMGRPCLVMVAPLFRCPFLDQGNGFFWNSARIYT